MTDFKSNFRIKLANMNKYIKFLCQLGALLYSIEEFFVLAECSKEVDIERVVIESLELFLYTLNQMLQIFLN